MLSAISVANYFIKTGIETGDLVTQMKLQKLLYYAYGWHWAYHDDKLFSEKIQAWKFGPVIPDVYHAAKEWGNEEIDSLLYAQVYDEYSHDLNFVKKVIKKTSSTRKKREFLDEIWKVYSPYGAMALSNATHAPGTPWKRVIDENDGLIYSNIVIPDTYIKEYFEQLLTT